MAKNLLSTILAASIIAGCTIKFGGTNAPQKEIP